MHYLLRNFDHNRPEIANAFDEASLWSAPFGLLLLREMPLIRSGRVLDVGCGTGFPLLPLSQRLGPDVQLTGIDPWMPAVERAHAKALAFAVPNVALHYGSATQLPFDDDEFDLVVSNLGLNNFADAPAAVAEAHRVLKHRGRLCLTTNPLGTFARFYEVLMESIAGLGEVEALHQVSQQIAARRTPHQIEELLTDAGLAIVRTVEETHGLRYASGSAFLNDYLIVLGFLPAWKELLPSAQTEGLFRIVEEKLNAIAKESGEYRAEVPMLYVEAQRTDGF
ncbi:MAG: methyltransferase domain-containing protein [Bacteroidota bacterium]